MTLLPGLIDAHSHLSWYFNRQGRYHTGGRRRHAGANRCCRWRQRLRDADGRRHDDPESRITRKTRICASGSRVGQVPGPRVLTSLSPFSSTRLDAGFAARARAPAQSAGRRRHQDLRVGEHSRRRRADAERRAAHGDLRRSEGAGHAHDGARAQRREHQGVGARGLQSDRARRVRQRRSAQADGRPAASTSIRRSASSSATISTTAPSTRGSATTTRPASRRWRRRFRWRPRCSSARSTRRASRSSSGPTPSPGAHGRNAEELVCRVKDGGQSPHRRHHLGDVAHRRVDAPGRSDRLDRAGTAGRHHRRAGRSDERHHGAATRDVRDEGRESLSRTMR